MKFHPKRNITKLRTAHRQIYESLQIITNFRKFSCFSLGDPLSLVKAGTAELFKRVLPEKNPSILRTHNYLFNI